MALCTISGTILDLTGDPVANQVITFDSQRTQVVGADIIPPTIVSTTTDANGVMTPISLTQGVYIQVNIGELVPFTTFVPFSTTTTFAVIASLVPQAPVTSPVLGGLGFISSAAPALSAAAQGTIYLDSTSFDFRGSQNGGAYDSFVQANRTQTLTNKTLTSPVITGATLTGTFTGTFISGSANPATAGILRLANAEGAQSRNAANNANLILLLADASNRTVVGNATAAMLLQSSGLFLLNGTTSATPGFKQVGATIQTRLGDDSGFANATVGDLLRLGGTAATEVAWKRSTTTLQARLADDSAFANVTVGNLLRIGGTSATEVALKRSTTTIQFRLADDSGYASALIKDVGFNRVFSTISTPVAASDFALSAGWGNTATKNVSTLSKDSCGELAILCQGSGIAANPDVTLTFKDGTWNEIPFVQVTPSTNASVTNGSWVVGNVTATTVVFRWFSPTSTLPTSGQTYTFQYMCMGTS